MDDTNIQEVRQQLTDMGFDKELIEKALMLVNPINTFTAVEWLSTQSKEGEKKIEVKEKVVEQSFNFEEGDDSENQTLMNTVATSVTLIDDIPYSESGHHKHYLNIHYPNNIGKNQRLPVVIHIHGGGWKRGDRNHLFYGAPFMGNAYASHGFVAVTISYRTGTSILNQISDVSNSVKWVYNNIDAFCGEKEKMFLSGHSAGGHLASLLVTNEEYLKGVGLSNNIFKAVVSISGIYTVNSPLSSDPGAIANMLYRMAYHKNIFENEQQCLLHSPSYHIEKSQIKLPPFLVINAGSDLGLDFDGRKFHDLLKKIGTTTEHKLFECLNHASITKNMSVVDYIVNFFNTHSKKL